MTLLEAFLFFRMPCTDPTLFERNNQAGAQLEAAQRTLGVIRPCNTTSVLDVRQDVIIRIGLKGPRCDAEGHPLPRVPSTDARVMGYLRTSVYRGCISWLRREHPERYAEEDPENTVSAAGGPGGPVEDDGYERYESLQARVLERYVPQLSELRRNAVDELLRIRRKETTVDELIKADDSAGDTPYETLRARRYRRYFDTVKDLHEMVSEDPELTDDDRTLAHRVVDDLRIQEAKPRRPRGAGGRAKT